MPGRLQQKLKELPDLSFYPESYLLANAMDNPVAFGQSHKAEISELVDTADLALLPFLQAKTKLESSLLSGNPMVRYWALMACTAFGEQAESLAPFAMPLLKDEMPIVAVRAAEFLGRIGKINPQPLLTKIVNVTDDPVLATEALNTIVWFKDFFDDRYPVDRNDFDRSTNGADVEDRLNYINGVPYPQKNQKADKKKKKAA